jgi:ABC-2 type transport system permease protein
MIGTFLYLTLSSMRNRLRTRVRRLREPRYLIGSVVGVLYFYYFIFGRSMRSGRPGRGGPSIVTLLTRFAGPIQLVGGVALLSFAALAWLLPASRTPIAFSRAEVQFLFQAPLSRRQLLHYKLLRSQLAVLFGSAIATVFLRPATLLSGWTFLVGMWLLLTLFGLYSIGVSLNRASLARRGARGVARHWVPLAALAGALLTLGVTIGRDWPTLSAFASVRDVFAELQRITASGAASWVLWPFRALVRLPLAGSAAEFFAALPVTLGCLGLAYVWVLRGDTAFEEAAADQAEARARLKTPARRASARVTPTPFALASDGRAETAILWKNLILMGRFASLKTLLRVAPLIVVLALSIGRNAGRGGVAAAVAVACLTAAGFTVLLGPQIMRNDLRQDLGNLAVLRTWPVGGPALIRGELLAPASVLSALAWLAILGGSVLFSSVPATGSVELSMMLNRVSYAAAALLVAPALIVAQLVVHNAIAVLFPAWVVAGASRSRGVDAMGQRLLMMAGILLSLVVSVLPGAVAAGLVMIVGYVLTNTILVVLPAFVMTLVVLAECALATEWLGRVLDRTDVSALEPAE